MPEKQELRFKYIFPEDYNPSYVNGVFGGASIQGEIVVNFTLERHPIPNSITHELEPDLSLGKEIRRDPDDYQKLLVRYVTSGVILNIRNARLIRDWLSEQIKLAEGIEGNIKANEESSLKSKELK